MPEISHNPDATDAACAAFDESERREIVDGALNDMRAAQDDERRLSIVRCSSSRLDPLSATSFIDRLSSIAIDVFSLPVDEVQKALAKGQDDRVGATDPDTKMGQYRRRARIVAIIDAARPFPPFVPPELRGQTVPATVPVVSPPGGRSKKRPKPILPPAALSLAAETPPPSSPAFREIPGGLAPGGFDIDEMNRQYALVRLGRKVVIYCDTEGKGVDDAHRYIGPDAFNIFYENRIATVPAHDGRMCRITWAKAWRTHPDRRTYRGIQFWPSPDNEPGNPGYLNLWQGFAVEPALLPDARRYGVFCDHLKTNICGGSVSLYRWVWAWLANMVQTPRNRPGVALVLRGGRGTGKTIVGEIIGRMFPQAYFLVDDPRYVTGHFNHHLSGCLLLQADEAVWAGDKVAEGRLKGLITSPINTIEVKGIDGIRMDNFVHLIQTSNEKWSTPAGEDERRYCVLDVSARCQGNHGYFAEMVAEIDNGGLSHLLADLLAFDLSTVNLRDVPATAALLDQKIHSFDSVTIWWLARLMAGSPTGAIDMWPDAVPCQVLFDDYVKSSEKVGIKRRRDETIFGRELRTLMPTTVEQLGLRREKRTIVIDSVTGETRRPPCYVLPPLAEAREAFEGFVGQPMEWPD